MNSLIPFSPLKMKCGMDREEPTSVLGGMGKRGGGNEASLSSL